MRYFLFVILLLSVGCTGIQTVTLNQYMHQLESKFNHNSGLVLYDPDKREIIYDYNGNHYFTPASNLKLFTFYTAYTVLGDSLATFGYTERNDTLILWPAGDPSFLNPEFPQNNRVLEKLKTHNGEIILSFAHADVTPFGPGWAWDDYPYTFSAERSAFPLYGNYFTANVNDSIINVSVPYFMESIHLADTLEKADFVRHPESNQTYYHPGMKMVSDTFNIPFKTNNLLSAQLLADTLKRSIIVEHIPVDTNAMMLKSIPLDTVYKKLLQESNNFVAEQLMLQVSYALFDTLSIEKSIDYSKEVLLSNSPQILLWKDGSGLSRYNLVTPQSVVYVLKKLYSEVGPEKLFKLLAVGGVSGTLKNYYKAIPPYIYAKTGTLSNNHNVSGYLITKKGKVFVFSFMNNNYPTSSAMIKEHMEDILWEIHLNN